MEQPSASSLRGLLLDDRYQLEQVRDGYESQAGPSVALWRAVDVSLDRYVAVLVAATRTKRAARAVAAAASRASRINDGRCVRVLDVGEVDSLGTPCVWVASEWVDGPSLAALVRRAPLPAPVAVDVIRQCAEMLAAAATVDCHHGRLHPDDLLLAGGTLPRISGVETAAALAEERPTEADDVRGVAALLFAALTGSWPLSGWSGLPCADHGDALHPRSVVSTVPREVDEVTARALSGGYATLDDLVRALRRLPSRAIDAPEPPADRRRSQTVRRWAWRVVPPLLVAVIAGGGWVIGSDLGRVPQSARARHAALPAPTTTAPGATRLVVVWTSPPSVTSFDPDGDGEENQDTVGFAVDHDPTTTWTTDLYKRADLGGLKPGVGLLIDLRHATAVRVAELALLGSGSDVELRAGDTAPKQATDLPLVASAARAGGTVTWTLRSQVTARYWLVWFTNLPKAKGGYRGGITDIALLGPRAG